MSFLHFVRTSTLLLASLTMLAATPALAATKPDVRAPELASPTLVDVDGQLISVQALGNAQGFVVRTPDGRVETLHRVGDHILRVIGDGGIAGSTRYDIIDTKAALADLSPAQIADAQAHLDSLVARSGFVEKGIGACSLEIAAYAVAVASVAASCGTATPACALAIAGLALASESLDRCLAVHANPIW